MDQSPTQPTQQISEALLWHKMTQVVVANAQPEVILSKLAAILGEEFRADGCVISICTRHSTQHHVASWFGDDLTANQQAGILATYSTLEAATLDAGSLIISELQTRDLIPEWRSCSIGSVLSNVTRFQGQVNGAISLMRSHSHSWTKLEATTLATISDQVAVTVSQILLQQQVLKQAQYQSLIQELTMAIQNSVDLPQILKLAIDGTAQALQIAQGSVLRLRYWDPRHNSRSLDGIPKARVTVECQWQPEIAQPQSSSLTSETLLSQSFWVSECVVCQSAVSYAEPTALSDRDDFPATTEAAGIAPLFAPERMPSLLMVPLESKNKLLGFITLQHDQPRVWQPNEIEFAELVGAQISSAIIQTETLRQVESLVEERTAQLQQSLELQAKLYEITRRQIEKLREMNQRMDEFLSTLSHELRTPLTSMMLAIRMLREADLPPDRREQYLNILEQQCAQETSLINDLLALQELESKQVAIQLQKVDLKQVITDLSQSFDQRWALKGLTLEIELPPRSPALNTDLASLNRILLELLTNAGKYSDPNSTVSVKVSQQSGQQIAIAICNGGDGISEEELPYIFEKFRRCQGVTQNAVPGTGLGLALVKNLVQHLNGTIAASSLPTDATQSLETRFTVTLPQNLEIA
ncbi:GAF domain-containing sensor histidine kinase [Phormidesmis priestleyi]|uniref:GAF domain-containing sensor histidine kinase n=1 Tax=Phormidesmis priestleyi TaxID=268141 RepID=UPI0015E675A8|nr:ATP-binding protein [Phormidesmis priestleyi]